MDALAEAEAEAEAGLLAAFHWARRGPGSAEARGRDWTPDSGPEIDRMVGVGCICNGARHS